MYYTEADYTQMALELGFELPRGYRGLVSCPQHEDKHPSMSINLRNGLFNCFSCQYKGRLDKEYYNVFKKSYNKKTDFSVQELSNLFKTKIKPRVVLTDKQRFQVTYDLYNRGMVRKWFNYRGIKPQVVDKTEAMYGTANITYIDDDGNKKTYSIRDRILIPIYNLKRELSSLEMRFPFFGTESVKFKDTVRKVLYPKCSTTNLLYEHYRLDPNQKLYVLEGLMDCLAFRSLTGIYNSTSIFGSNITNYQKEVLNTFPKICYVYNNDKAGRLSLSNLQESYTGTLTKLKPAKTYKDVGEMTMNQFSEVDLWLQTEQC